MWAMATSCTGRSGGIPDGAPAMVVHGGPGGGSPGRMPGVFNPVRDRVVLFDQRGCGRSTPHASDPTTDMSVNTAVHLVRDMEQLRAYLGIERMLLFGGSWGSALSLGYAEQRPERVRALVLPAFWLMGRDEVDWLYRGVPESCFLRSGNGFGTVPAGNATWSAPMCD